MSRIGGGAGTGDDNCRGRGCGGERRRGGVEAGSGSESSISSMDSHSFAAVLAFGGGVEGLGKALVTGALTLRGAWVVVYGKRRGRPVNVCDIAVVLPVLASGTLA